MDFMSNILKKTPFKSESSEDGGEKAEATEEGIKGTGESEAKKPGIPYLFILTIFDQIFMLNLMECLFYSISTRVEYFQYWCWIGGWILWLFENHLQQGKLESSS